MEEEDPLELEIVQLYGIGGVGFVGKALYLSEGLVNLPSTAPLIADFRTCGSVSNELKH